MFTSALFSIAKMWKQPKCFSIDEWIKKKCGVCVYTHAHRHTHTHTHSVYIYIVSSIAQLCPALCIPICQASLSITKLPELAQTRVHQVGDAIHASHPPSSPSPPAFHLSQYQGLFNESVLHIRWPKSFSFSISPSSDYLVSISFRID